MVTNFAYDYEDRITQITRSGMMTNTMSYNGFGARVSAVDSLGTRTFARNGTGVTAPVLGDGMANYTPGISERRGGVTRHYAGDAKNDRSQLSTDQALAGTKSFDSYGEVIAQSGSWTGWSGHGGRSGYQTETDTHLQLLGNRFYSPSSGRFVSRDHEKDGRNWYTYCYNNPVAYSDPNGNRPIAWPVEDKYPGEWVEPKDDRSLWQKLKDGAFDFIVGWGDGASFGLSGVIREGISPGCSATIDEDSWAYKGGYVGGVLNVSLIAVEAAGAAKFGKWSRVEKNPFAQRGVPGGWGKKNWWHIHWWGSGRHWPWDTRMWTSIELLTRRAFLQFRKWWTLGALLVGSDSLLSGVAAME